MVVSSIDHEERENEETNNDNALLKDYPSSSQSTLSTPLITSDIPEKKSASVLIAAAHIITAVIGSGVLSLAWSVAQLGWIAGPVSIISMGFVTILSSHLLCDCYKAPDPEYGPLRNRSFHEAVRVYLGNNSEKICSFFVHLTFYGFGIAYTITSAISMRAIQEANCYHREGHDAACSYGDKLYMLLFGILQVALSQIPNFYKLKWLSIVAAVMSFSYSSIGMGLGIAEVVENGAIDGSIEGISTSTALEKVWLVAQAMGDVAFAFNFNTILIEIEDTLGAPPSENITMKKASTLGMFITTFFYLCCGCFGYAAFGDATPGNLLTGFGFYEPYWLIDFANACVVLHLVGGYQVYCQPFFASVEGWLVSKYPNSEFVTRVYTVKLPLMSAINVSPLRLFFRTAYVTSTTVIALIFPYFNQVLGVLGALNFWPLAIYFPVEMYLVQKNIRAWTMKWMLLQAFRIVFLLGTMVALIGSIQGLVTAESTESS